MLYIAAGNLTPTNLFLLAACNEAQIEAALLPPETAAERAVRGDVVLARLDILPTLDGIEPGLWELRKLERRGVRVINGGGALLASHDKLMTALRLAEAGLPHPRTAHVDGGNGLPELDFPLVVKPRLGSWGRDVALCKTEAELKRTFGRLRHRRWFEQQGVLLQELVPPCGFDLRLVVAAGRVVGAVERVAAHGEWRTNVALGGTRRRVDPPEEARALALAAAAAIGGGLVGVDLLPCPSGGYVVLELNGAVDFTDEYALDGTNPFVEAVRTVVHDAVAPALVAAM
jgi:[lysine-biosynthesis-protein LysW]--L-2-aminoadipate ligase